MKDYKVRATYTIEPELKKRLDDHAKMLGFSSSLFVSVALKHFLDEHKQLSIYDITKKSVE